MRKLFWLALGASVGVLIFHRLSRAAARLTPQGMAGSIGAGLSDLGYSLREFAADVREAMSAQESALRAAAGLDSGSADGLAAAGGSSTPATAEAGPAADQRSGGASAAGA